MPKTVKKSKKNVKFSKRNLLFLILVFIAVFAVIPIGFYFSDRIFPGIKVAGIDVGLKTKEESINLLKSQVSLPDKIQVNVKNQTYDLSLSGIDASYNYTKTVDLAYSEYRNERSLSNVLKILSSPFKSKNVKLVTDINKVKLSEYLQIVSAFVTVKPVTPSVSINSANNISVNKGISGEVVDSDTFQNNLVENLSDKNYSEIDLPLIEDNTKLSDDDVTRLKNRAGNFLTKSITLESEDQSFVIKDKDLVTFLDPRGGYNDKNILKYLDKSVVPNVNREPQDAKFNFENGNVTEFLPSKEGLTVNENLLKSYIITQLFALESGDQNTADILVPVESKSPQITLDKVNQMGIRELIGRGTSEFFHSIPGRIYNIGLASSKINGALVAPGETFSFDRAVGDVSSLTGYQQAYIIQDGRTVLGDGGGVCQVSTTLFRAALNAGLPIVERVAHAYRVGYYEQDSPPGLDATVFSPSVDFKFQNNTPGYLLIQTIYEPKKLSLAFEIYGTNDGRISTISKPVVGSVSAPPPDLYQDDPTLPTGVIKQVDFKAWGAKVSFDYTVSKDGSTIYNKTFYSNYRPWQAIYLRGTGPAK